MDARSELRRLRVARGWSQAVAAARVGVSQTYWSLLEGGARDLTPRLAARLVEVGLGARHLPLPRDLMELGEPAGSVLVEHLSALGYPGFGHFPRSRQPHNPATVVLWALASSNLEPRVLEALPWLLVRYWPLDEDWVVGQAKLHDLQNRLGYVVNLARRLAERDGFGLERVEGLTELEARLEPSRLAREDTLCAQATGAAMRAHLRRERSPVAAHWNLLTDWKVEHLRRVEQDEK